jgi:glutathione S-transferase
MILYGSSLSPFVRKVLVYAGEKGIEVELQPTGFPNHSPEYLEASPFRKMPAFRDGDYTLADSSAIVHYLEAKFPDPALIPTEPKLRGKTIRCEEFADTIACAAVGKIFFNRIVAPRFMGRQGDEEAAAACEREDLPHARLSRADGTRWGRVPRRRSDYARRYRRREPVREFPAHEWEPRPWRLPPDQRLSRFDPGAPKLC